MNAWTVILHKWPALVICGAFVCGCNSSTDTVIPPEEGLKSMAHDARWVIDAASVGEQDKPLPSLCFLSTADEAASAVLQQQHLWMIRVPEKDMSQLVQTISALSRDKSGAGISDLPKARYGTYRFRIWERGKVLWDYTGSMRYSRQVFEAAEEALDSWPKAREPVEAVVRRLRGESHLM